jgi:hypothetical protein
MAVTPEVASSSLVGPAKIHQENDTSRDHRKMLWVSRSFHFRPSPSESVIFGLPPVKGPKPSFTLLGRTRERPRRDGHDAQCNRH